MARLFLTMVALAIATSAAHADTRGELELSQLASMPGPISARACTFNKTDDEKFDQWTNVTVLLFENRMPISFPDPYENALSQDVVMSFVRDGEIFFFCGNGVIGKDENCGSGEWTQAWARCAYDVMRTTLKPVPLNEIDRTGLLQLGQSTSCGTISVDHHYECTVSTPAK